MSICPKHRKSASDGDGGVLEKQRVSSEMGSGICVRYVRDGEGDDTDDARPEKMSTRGPLEGVLWTYDGVRRGGDVLVDESDMVVIVLDNDEVNLRRRMTGRGVIETQEADGSSSGDWMEFAEGKMKEAGRIYGFRQESMLAVYACELAYI
ncbi:hypothetical protein BDQ17DRAFT_1329947 [Cyathus striatus]|nr:hypothetical protein BDQ17DRAFT_1329947 [Cyathus striatus]